MPGNITGKPLLSQKQFPRTPSENLFGSFLFSFPSSPSELLGGLYENTKSAAVFSFTSMPAAAPEW